MTIQKMAPDISVVIPTYNRKERVLDAIKSALAQGDANFEVIVVDDGSTDGTVEYLRALDLPIRLVTKANGGASSARNAGVKEARGRYIALLDSDDLWLPGKLAAQFEYLQSHAEIVLVYTNEYIEADGVREPLSRFDKEKPGKKLALPAFVDYMPIHTSAVMFRKNIFEEVGGFSEELIVHEDSELWNRMSEKYEFGYIEEPFALYRFFTGEDHLTSPKKRKLFWEEGRKYLGLYVERRKSRGLTPEEQKAVEESHALIEKLSTV